MSWDSLKPPNNFLWKVSFCQVLIRSPSSDTRERQMEACKEASRPAEVMKHCHAFIRDPYRGPEEDRRWETKNRKWIYFRRNSDATVGMKQKVFIITSDHEKESWSHDCTYWSPPLVSTCGSIRSVAGRTAVPSEPFLGNMPLSHYRLGRCLLFVSQCSGSSQAGDTEKKSLLWAQNKPMEDYESWY